MRPLDRLLRPRSIAVVGGGVWCANLVRELDRIGFRGEVWPVHPRRAELGGRTAVARIEDLPGAPDAAFLGVNRAATVEAAAALSALGCGGVVCFASGFREAEAETGDGADLQSALLAAAGEMRVLGPNCYGLINALDGVALWPDQHGLARVERGVAVLAQSSNIALNVTMQRRGLPLAYVATIGNQAQTGIAELGAALLEDPRVTALGLYIEGVGDLAAFERLAETSRALEKPVVALKAGFSDQSRAAAASHTASLAGSEAGARALLERLGIARAESLTELLETLKLLHAFGPLRSNRIAALSCSGGEASLMGDAAARRGLALPPLSGAQTRDLRAVLGERVALANPLDYHTYIWHDPEALAACFTAMLDPDLALGCVVLDFPREDRCDPSEWRPALDAAERASRARGVPVAVVATMPENLPEAVAEEAAARGLVALMGVEDALGAARLAVQLGRKVRPAAALLPPGAARTARRDRRLTEAQAKAALAAQGVVVPRGAVAATAAEAAGAAERLGAPVALKGAGAAHKTEAGAVVLGLRTAEEVRRAAERMDACGYLVEEMAGDGVAELLVGVVRDPAHGFVLTLAAGGVLTELVQDAVSRLLPVTAEDIDRALDALRIAPLLDGYRGAPPADRSAIVAAVLAVQAYVTENAATVAEVEINPLICAPGRAVAVDALIRLEEPA
ncbi:MAG: acetate--CoA ligase family protein [Pseudomonadota bacterium]